MTKVKEIKVGTYMNTADTNQPFSKTNMPGVTFAPNGEIIHNGPLAERQNWDQYTQEDHELWAFLYQKQLENLHDIAYTPWIDAMQTIGIHRQQIPKLGEVAKLMHELTGWIPIPINGFLEAKDYFAYVAKRQFPTVVRIRTWDAWEFQVDPDLFHDAFGHLPMHADAVLADFLQLFGQVALNAQSEQQIIELTRLYWFTIEYGLIREHGKVKVCGSGHMSGFKEARYSLTDEVEKRPFVFEDVIQQDFNPHVLQKTLFIMDSYEQVFAALERYSKQSR
jgi:phenylalanine-4-hydroxylase